jgi:hypothetical protein
LETVSDCSSFGEGRLVGCTSVATGRWIDSSHRAMPTSFEIASRVRVGIVAWVVSCPFTRSEGDTVAASGIVS